MMDSYLSDETKDITLTLQLNQIEAAIEQINATKRSAEQTIEDCVKQITFLEERRGNLKKNFQYSKELRVRNTYYNEFNGICITCDFDLEEVLKKGATLIAKIKLIDPTFNPEARLKRYKLLMDDY
jgi:hypothetical protein